MKKFVAWDSERRLSFAVPFADMKPVIYLDPFLPRISELALSKSDRQTKVRCLMSWSFHCLFKADDDDDNPLKKHFDLD